MLNFIFYVGKTFLLKTDRSKHFSEKYLFAVFEKE